MGRPLYGYVCDGYWQDIGNLDQYRQANFDALDERVALEHPGHPPARQRLARRGRRARRPRADRGPGVHRQLLPHRAASATVGPYSVLVRERDAARAARAPTRSVIDASTHIGRSALDRGRDRRPLLRHPRARPHPRGRRDRRRGHDRRAERRHAGRADLPVQGGRDRRAGPREPDLGVARVLARCSASDGVSGLVNVDLTPEVAVAARGRARHGAQARRARRREPRVAPAPAG